MLISTWQVHSLPSAGCREPVAIGPSPLLRPSRRVPSCVLWIVHARPSIVAWLLVFNFVSPLQRVKKYIAYSHLKSVYSIPREKATLRQCKVNFTGCCSPNRAADDIKTCFHRTGTWTVAAVTSCEYFREAEHEGLTGQERARSLKNINVNTFRSLA